MKRYNKRIFHMYFGDLFEWLIMTAMIFVIAFVVAIMLNGWNVFYLAIPICWAAIWLFEVRYIIASVCVYKEIENDNYVSKKIIISRVELDKEHNFYSRNRLIGKPKMLIIDSDGEFYRIVADKTACYRDWAGFKGREFEVVYLSESRFLLNIKPSGIVDESKKGKQFMKSFKSVFGKYDFIIG